MKLFVNFVYEQCFLVRTGLKKWRDKGRVSVKARMTWNKRTNKIGVERGRRMRNRVGGG